MRWQYKFMVDPGDGIVSTRAVELPTDNLKFAAYLISAELPSGYWLFAVEAVPPVDAPAPVAL